MAQNSSLDSTAYGIVLKVRLAVVTNVFLKSLIDSVYTVLCLGLAVRFAAISLR